MLMLTPVEHFVTKFIGNGVNVSGVYLNYEMSDVVETALLDADHDRWYGKWDIGQGHGLDHLFDLMIVPFPVLRCMEQSSDPRIIRMLDYCVTGRVKDRVSKVLHSDVFCFGQASGEPEMEEPEPDECPLDYDNHWE